MNCSGPRRRACPRSSRRCSRRSRERFGLQWRNEPLGAAEEAVAWRVYREEIGTDEFVAEVDDPAHEADFLSGTHTCAGGTVTSYVRLEGPARKRIGMALITGDFFVAPPRTILDLEAALRGAYVEDAAGIIDRFFAEHTLSALTVTPADFRASIEAALGSAAPRRVKTLTVLQHTSAEYLGLIEDHLEGRRIRFRYSRPFATGGRVPKPGQLLDGLVLLGGGPWGSAGDRNVPTLIEELTLTKAALQKGLPVLGIGLGAQLLAIIAGRFRTADRPRASTSARRRAWTRMRWQVTCRNAFRSWSMDVTGPCLPDDARILAVDAAGHPAVFQVGANALGFTGHPGVKAAIIEDLVMEFEEAPADPGPATCGLRTLQRSIEDALVPIMTGVVKVLKLME